MLKPQNTEDSVGTKPASNPSEFDLTHIKHAVLQARIGLEEGGVPIGGCLVSKDGVVFGCGRNKRVQENSAIKHGETDCFNNIGRLPARMYKGCTIYTTLSPCTMCSGAIVLFGIERVVMGENDTFVGGEAFLKSRGVEVVNLDLQECKDMMAQFIRNKPEVWNEDIGED